jgi:hypothetical protein
MHIVDPDKAHIATATAAGSFVALLLTRRFTPLYVLNLIVIGQVSAFYFTIWIAQAFNLTPLAWPPIAFTIGLLGMYAWDALISILTKLKDDPAGMVTAVTRLWKGGK